MKKTIITLVLVAASAVALMSTNALAWNNWGRGGCAMGNGGYGMRGGYGMMGGGYGMMGRGYARMNNYYQGNIDDTAYQAFQQDTADIRTSLSADIAEMNAIMAGANPDAQRVRALSENISTKQNQLAEAARKNNIRLVGNGGNGWYCNRW